MKKILLVLIVFLVLFLTVRGIPGNPNKINMNDPKWVEGPFELSPERGRFALTFSLVEDKSFEFGLPVARFATPDLGYINGKFVSIFAPGISFLTIPGYKLGKLLGLSQVGVFATISLFASINVLLIFLIAKKLGAAVKYSLLAALVFLFATPAFTYGVTLYQHHVSVFLLLLTFWTYLSYKGALANWFIWFLIALSIPVDFPNFFLMIPMALVVLTRTFPMEDKLRALEINFRPAYFLAILGVVLPALFFLWVNMESYGNAFQLSGGLTNVKSIDSQGLPHKDFLLGDNNLNDFRSVEPIKNSNVLGFFNSRNISRGLYVNLFSPDRGMLLFAPILIFSLIGAKVMYKKETKAFSVLLMVGLINLFVYSMWGDPWGGWAYGARYLIPLYAVLSIFLAFGIEKILRIKALNIVFSVVLVYSILINTLGAVTTSANPPQVEVLQLESLSGKQEKYTPERNWDFLREKGSKSFVYQKYFSKNLTPFQFYIIIALVVSCLLFGVSYYEFFVERIFKRYFVIEFTGIESTHKAKERFAELLEGDNRSIWKER